MALHCPFLSLLYARTVPNNLNKNTLASHYVNVKDSIFRNSVTRLRMLILITTTALILILHFLISLKYLISGGSLFKNKDKYI